MDANRLPGDVIENILVYLPMLEAVKTSQLSRGWRHAWKSIPRLAFDKNSFRRRPGEETLEFERRVVKAVTYVLLLHAGPIHEFKLSTNLRGCQDVDLWVSSLPRKGVKRIVLDFFRGDEYKLPSGIFECELLNHLELYRCVLRLPALFKGFRDLISLNLQHVIVSVEELEHLISNCPLLEEVDLRNNVGCDEIRIRAPRLRKLRLVGSFRCLRCKDCPVLATASFELSTAVPPQGDVHETGSCTGGLIEFFSAMPCVHNLEIRAHFLEVLSSGDIPERLPAALKQLRNITMDVNLEALEECTAALCLLRSCPSLRMLKLRHRPSAAAGADIIPNFWEAKEGLDCKLNELITVEMSDVAGVDSEMAFIGFLLANAPRLCYLNVKLNKKVSDDVPKFKMVTKCLLSCPRLSEQARIVLLE